MKGKRSSLLLKLKTYGRKKFYNIGPWWWVWLASTLDHLLLPKFDSAGDRSRGNTILAAGRCTCHLAEYKTTKWWNIFVWIVINDEDSKGAAQLIRRSTYW
jgi:hypothetical protein